MEVKVLNITYHVPEVIINTCDYKSFRKYLSKGFFVSSRENGYCTLKKSSQVLTQVEYEGSICTVDLKKVLFNYYVEGKTRQLIRNFKQDLDEGKIRLEADSNGYCIVTQ